MKLKEQKSLLKKKAGKIVNFTPQEMNEIFPDEMQHLLYDLQVYQIELEMINDELQKIQREFELSRNRFHFLHHDISVGILTINYQGVTEGINDFFCKMLDIKQLSTWLFSYLKRTKISLLSVLMPSLKHLKRNQLCYV